MGTQLYLPAGWARRLESRLEPVERLAELEKDRIQAKGDIREILDRLIKDLGDKAIVEFRPRQEGNTLHLILAPPKEQKPAGKSEKHEKPEKQAAPRAQPPAPAPPQQQQ